MKNYSFSLLILVCFLIGCSIHESTYKKIQPAQIVKHDDKPSTLTLTPDAIKRLSIKSQTFLKTADFRVIPVSALIYDNQGVAWVFVESSESQFQRAPIQIIATKGNLIHITDSIPDSDRIVIQGAAELNGTEAGVGK